MQKPTTIYRKNRSLMLKIWRRKLTLVFAAGCLGGLLNSLAVWLFGLTGITALFGVAIAPTLTPTWLYPRIVWGGLWGFLFLGNSLSKNSFYRSFLYSLFPTFVQLGIIFPFSAHQGFMGIELGRLTPIFVLLFNYIWAIGTGFWLKSIYNFKTSDTRKIISTNPIRITFYDSK